MNPRLPIPLIELLQRASLVEGEYFGNPDVMVTSISTHAQRTGRNGMFVALEGTKTDSHMLVSEAVSAGASVVVVQKDAKPYPGVTMVKVPDTRAALGHLAQAFFRNPTRAMLLCGITGTNGKSTSTHLVSSILRTAGMRPGLVGTLGAYFDGEFLPLNQTTPGPLELAEIFARMEEAKVDSLVMEVSSHAIHQRRINGLKFRAGGLTCVTQDHLDYHGDMPTYIGVKRSFFFDYVKPTPGSMSVFNADDPVGEELVRNYTGDLLAYSARPDAEAAIRARNVQMGPTGTAFELDIEGRRADVSTRLVGAFNVSNMLAAAGCASVMGAEPGDIAEGLRRASQVPGRMEFVDLGQPFGVIVDYAHTPDALERVLRTCRRLCSNRLLVVFGCGGDRDRAKRAIMGRIAGDLADFAIVTNDNPRSEEPRAIARQVVEGILASSLKSNRYQVLLDRHLAIEAALNLACPGDMVVIAGKGHESYQEVSGIRTPFDDRAVAAEILRSIAENYAQEPSVHSIGERVG